MKILLAVDEGLYSRYAAAETAKLALNSWADVTILGLCGPGGESGPSVGGELLEALHSYRQMFLDQGSPENNPYLTDTESTEWVPVGKDLWEELRVLRGGRKRLRVCVRPGDANQVLIEDASEDYDLIVLGCGPQGESLAGGAATLQKIVENPRASVLLVKQDHDIHKLFCCLDNHDVPQRSLEMINLLATIHDAELELVGVMREGWIKIEVDQELSKLGRYFFSNQSQVRTGFKEHATLEPFVSQEARPDLLVLWRGKQSILNSLFPKKWLKDLVDKSASSVLVLR